MVVTRNMARRYGTTKVKTNPQAPSPCVSPPEEITRGSTRSGSAARSRSAGSTSSASRWSTKKARTVRESLTATALNPLPTLITTTRPVSR